MPDTQDERDRLMFELVVLHQLLLERFKLYQVKQFDPILQAAAKEVRLIIGSIEYETLREMPRREFNRFVGTLSTIEIFDQYIEEQKEMLERLSYIETEAHRKLVGLVVEKEIKVNPETIWATTRNEPLTASLLFGALTDFKNRIKKMFTQLVHRNYVADAPVVALKREIIGSSKNSYRDGLFARLKKQSKVLTNTVVQHVSSLSNELVSSTVYEKYEWNAMLDSATCDECGGLHGQVFNLDEGPRPPIHYNCRCMMVPIEGDGRITPPMDEWLDTQTPKMKRTLTRPLSLDEYEQQVEELAEKGIDYGT